MATSQPAIGLFYDDSAYVETVRSPHSAGSDGPMGLMGRQVAGREFLDAFLTHGNLTWLGVLKNEASSASLAVFFRTHPRMRDRALRTVAIDQFLTRSDGKPAAPILYTPSPPEAGLAWMRHERGRGLLHYRA